MVCESEGNESVAYCKEDPTCIMQGTIVFLIGISVLFDLAIEFICIDASPTQRNPRTAFVSIVLLPAFWLLLASTAVSSKSYYCTDMPCIAKHFLYPVLVTLRNPGVACAVFACPEFRFYRYLESLARLRKCNGLCPCRAIHLLVYVAQSCSHCNDHAAREFPNTRLRYRQSVF